VRVATTLEQHELLRRLFFRLERFGTLSEEEKRALQQAVSRTRQIDAREDLSAVHEYHCNLLLEGFACDYMLLPDGRRQIMNLHVPGDFCDLDLLLLSASDRSVGALTRVTVALIPHHKLLDLAERYPRILLALWRDTLIDAAISRECIANIGRRNAYVRIAHLLCELYLRLNSVGLVHDGSFDLPLTQTDLADATGLSVVHVNRTIQRMRADWLISWAGKLVTVHDQKKLEETAEFRPGYLNLRGEPLPRPTSQFMRRFTLPQT
jgi:CRP-like cAMP-binding protein